MSYRRYNSYSRDPRWLIARYEGKCSCGAAVPRGARALYWPIGKKIECASCGETSWRRFESEAADEYAFGA